ncbi:DUF222 domain-containing protein [Mycobacterium camsae]|uniref:DUF222 domain-containing protein n=1 Tax=Mycobacterium gordonae TaxID=1778 RepID=UPI00198060A6|nr:DUF222 domain-containing protein [Mycobacterium gordonae]
MIAEAADLGPRRALTGEPLSPVLPANAAAQRQGQISDGNVAVIREFFAKLPDTVDAAARTYAEGQLALAATGFRPDELAEYAQVLKDCLKPDDDFLPAHLDFGRPLTN